MKYKQCYLFQEYINSMYLNSIRNLMYMTYGTIPKFYPCVYIWNSPWFDICKDKLTNPNYGVLGKKIKGKI